MIQPVAKFVLSNIYAKLGLGGVSCRQDGVGWASKSLLTNLGVMSQRVCPVLFKLSAEDQNPRRFTKTQADMLTIAEDAKVTLQPSFNLMRWLFLKIKLKSYMSLKR